MYYLEKTERRDLLVFLVSLQPFYFKIISLISVVLLRRMHSFWKLFYNYFLNTVTDDNLFTLATVCSEVWLPSTSELLSFLVVLNISVLA